MRPAKSRRDSEAEALLVAVGRRTVTEDLNLDVTDVEVDDRGIIQVDEYGGRRKTCMPPGT